MSSEAELMYPDIGDIGNGGLREDYNDAMTVITDDVVDPNKDLGPREILVRITFTPSSDRKEVGVKFRVDAKLGRKKTGSDTLHVGRHMDGDPRRRTLYRVNINQMHLTFNDLKGRGIETDEKD